MKVPCEMCGRNSTDPDVCSFCGASLGPNGFEHVASYPTMEWGWAEISIDAVPAHERSKAVAVLREGWAGLEGFTVLHLLKSQADQFSFETSAARVFVKRDLLHGLINRAQKEVATIAVTFTLINEPITTAEGANRIISARR